MTKSKDIYFVQKEGHYYHGVYFIGENKEEAIKAAKFAAETDMDSYHTWSVYKYISESKGDIDFSDFNRAIFLVNKEGKEYRND